MPPPPLPSSAVYISGGLRILVLGMHACLPQACSLQAGPAPPQLPRLLLDPGCPWGALLACLVNTLWTVLATADSSAAREAGRQGAVKALLKVLPRAQHEPHTLEACLGALAMLMSRAPLQRGVFVAAAGHCQLLGMLQESSLGGAARQAACSALQHVVRCDSGAAAFAAAGGVEALFAQLDRLGGSGGGHAVCALEADRFSAMEELLSVVAALASSPDQGPAFLTPAWLKLLLQAFKHGMSGFSSPSGSYRVAVACVLVLQPLSALPGSCHALVQAGVLGPLLVLLERGGDYSSCEGVKAAMIVHGAWGVLAVLSRCVTSAGAAGGPSGDRRGQVEEQPGPLPLAPTSSGGPTSSCGPAGPLVVSSSVDPAASLLSLHTLKAAWALLQRTQGVLGGVFGRGLAGPDAEVVAAGADAALCAGRRGVVGGHYLQAGGGCATLPACGW